MIPNAQCEVCGEMEPQDHDLKTYGLWNCKCPPKKGLRGIDEVLKDLKLQLFYKRVNNGKNETKEM